MNKAEFVSFMAHANNSSKVEADKALNMVIESVTAALAQGGSVNLVGFGAFTVQKRNAREGRNPKTGAKMHIAAYMQPSFKGGKKLKDACN
ncbi:MAG: HU family DNA-binding protein [Alphaproteobacteria bacterium]|nr:HU family DNA-binding protein [Alphaproteobacteria bacterium]